MIITNEFSIIGEMTEEKMQLIKNSITSKEEVAKKWKYFACNLNEWCWPDQEEK